MGMHKERRGTASARITQLEAKTTKLGKTQNVLATFIVLWPTQQPSHISPYCNTTIVRSVMINKQRRHPNTGILGISQRDLIIDVIDQS